MRIALCVDRGICATNEDGRELLAETTVAGEGAFSATIDSTRTAAFFLYAEAQVDHGTVYRRVFALDSLQPGDVVHLDPDSEAAVRLMDDVGLDRFSAQSVGAVNDAVASANAGLDFTGQKPEAAANLATSNAESDPDVQAALNVPPLPKVRSEGDGCQIDGRQGGAWAAIILVAGLFALLRARARRETVRSDLG